MSETFGLDSTRTHYRIVSKIGAGGMGEVYWARSPGGQEVISQL